MFPEESGLDPTAFGGIVEHTSPGLRIPIDFAGGLHDRDLGFVRFGWRDYAPFTGRWIAPDPIGDRGGDPDWYGYCLDDPVKSFYLLLEKGLPQQPVLLPASFVSDPAGNHA